MVFCSFSFQGLPKLAWDGRHLGTKPRRLDTAKGLFSEKPPSLAFQTTFLTEAFHRISKTRPLKWAELLVKVIRRPGCKMM